MNYKKIVLLFSCSLALQIALSVQPLIASEWVTEEVLKQLSELRIEVKKVRSELAELREELSSKDGGKKQEGLAISVDVDGDPMVGGDSANYAIVEFTDFQCPYCGRHQRTTFPKIEEKYIKTGKIQYISKQFPLDFHLQARDAASAALCAEKQKVGGYWSVHEWLFSQDALLSTDGFKKLANNFDLDYGLLESCMSSDSVSSDIDNDIGAGVALGVNGTPAFYIGRIEGNRVLEGVLVSGAQPFQVFDSQLSNVVE